MAHHHMYVPMVEFEETKVVNTSGECVQLRNAIAIPLLFGGDQLTVARARLAKNIRDNSETPTDRFEGLIPVVEDWHAKQALLGVSMLYNYSVCVIKIILYTYYYYKDQN